MKHSKSYTALVAISAAIGIALVPTAAFAAGPVKACFQGNTNCGSGTAPHISLTPNPVPAPQEYRGAPHISLTPSPVPAPQQAVQAPAPVAAPPVAESAPAPSQESAPADSVPAVAVEVVPVAVVPLLPLCTIGLAVTPRCY